MAKKTLARPRQTAIVAPTQVPDVQPVQSSAALPASGRFEGLLDAATREILSVTYWFDPAPQPEPYPIIVRFTGQRVGAPKRPQPGDQFVHDETIDAVVPGSGPISVTARIQDINPGEWQVTAQALPPAYVARRPGKRESPDVAMPVSPPRHPAARFWRSWARSAGSSAEAGPAIKTCPPILAHTPGIFPGAWITFVIMGIILALAIESLVVTHDRLAVGSLALLEIAGLAVGFIGAKLWFVVKHWSEHQWIGWCIQGFVAGATATVIFLLLIQHLSVGVFLDATAPGMLMGMAVGRIGCFFAGCCGGPATAARWGIWSSDERVGARRVPTQLLEAAFTAILGFLALAVLLRHGPVNGAIFVTFLAAYTLGRQGVLRLRAEPHRTGLGEVISTAAAALVFLAAAAVVVAHIA
jgi:phosphatidylglycerol:prolipoprotein diacylglycerol transferase